MFPQSIDLASITLGAMVLGTMPIHAATVISDDFSVWTNVDGTEETFTSSTDPIFSQQTIQYNGNHEGLTRGAASAMQFSDLGDGQFSYEAGNVSSAPTRPPGWPATDSSNGPFGGADTNIVDSEIFENPETEDKIRAGSLTTFTVTFELGIGEVKQANLWLNYTIEIANGNQNTAAVEWSLSNEFQTLGISNRDARSVEGVETVDTGILSEVLDEPGTYTLTLSADIPYQDFNNANKTALATLDAVYFEVVNIPEPSTSYLLALTSACLLFRKRRAI
ncbi:PEP-CTERM sorting domain-containing protein [Verrucomicrobiaceae bacterium N1E253]|uniref:PEP-CTERM sorting domain-containing protein n=1 Tax=Oceaniferula marina TaxID=2748318 RepID=A0A851GC45_9BACT|nr:PEP-CTERM sorting domain-containing protein [Oceaniferula marina]NWK55308.1 PEP-CTERM sorting domain-containing protein [Oceaniferula marina]